MYDYHSRLGALEKARGHDVCHPGTGGDWKSEVERPITSHHEAPSVLALLSELCTM